MMFKINKDVFKEFLKTFHAAGKDMLMKNIVLANRINIHVDDDGIWARVAVESVAAFGKISNKIVTIGEKGTIPVSDISSVLDVLDFLGNELTVEMEDNMLKISDEKSFYKIPTSSPDLIDTEKQFEETPDFDFQFHSGTPTLKTPAKEVVFENEIYLEKGEAKKLDKIIRKLCNKLYVVAFNVNEDKVVVEVGEKKSSKIHCAHQLATSKINIKNPFSEKYIGGVGIALANMERPSLYFGLTSVGYAVVFREFKNFVSKVYYVMPALEEEEEEE